MKEFFSRNRLDDRGGASAEFAVVLPLLLLLVLSIFEFGRAYWIRNNLQFAVEEAGRWVMVNSSPIPSTATVQTQFNSRLTALAPGDVVFATALTPITGSVAGTQALQITATYGFTFIGPLSALTAIFSPTPLPAISFVGQVSIPVN